MRIEADDHDVVIAARFERNPLQADTDSVKLIGHRLVQLKYTNSMHHRLVAEIRAQRHSLIGLVVEHQVERNRSVQLLFDADARW